MKKFVATILASVAFMGAAFAGEVEGVVKAFDEATRTITLEDDSAYVLAEGVAVEGLEAGKSVKITFDDGTTNATAVEVAM